MLEYVFHEFMQSHVHSYKYLSCQRISEYVDYIPYRKIRPSPQKRSLRYDTKLRVMVMLQFLRCEESGEVLHNHYSWFHLVS